MPITLPPISRRRFLASTLASTALLALKGRLSAAEAGVDHLALVSDTHIAADPSHVARGVNMAEHLRKVLAQILALPERPAAMLLNGDCAYNMGEAGDYATLVELLR